VDCFKRPQYSNDGTIGWQEVKRQVKAYGGWLGAV
jgi:hypothetical protein